MWISSDGRTALSAGTRLAARVLRNTDWIQSWMVKAGEVSADGNLNTVFCDPHGVTGRLSKLELFQGSLVRGTRVAVNTSLSV